MPKYFKIPDQIISDIDEMMEIHEETLDEDIEKNITNESIISKHLYETMDTLIEIESVLDIKKREMRLKYITGNTDPDDIGNIRLNRGEIDSMLDGNPTIRILNQKKKELENMIKYYERSLQAVRNKNFAMKNIIDYRKFQNGIG